MLSICTLSEWEDIVRAAVTDAKNGDHKAREWLTSHVIGQAKEHSITFTALDEKASSAKIFDMY